MLRIYTMLTVAAFTLRERPPAPARDEAGAVLEYVVIALGLLLAASAVVAVITGAVDTRLAKIK